jgi:hypothetical protein
VLRSREGVRACYSWSLTAPRWSRWLGGSCSLFFIHLAYQPPASSTFLSEQTSHQQPASSTFLSEQISTSHQPPAKRTGRWWALGVCGSLKTSLVYTVRDPPFRRWRTGTLSEHLCLCDWRGSDTLGTTGKNPVASRPSYLLLALTFSTLFPLSSFFVFVLACFACVLHILPRLSYCLLVWYLLRKFVIVCSSSKEELFSMDNTSW